MSLRTSRWWLTVAITYADRLLAFAVPFFVLKGLHDEAAYTVVEYIISLSVMVATFGDLGIRNYVLYQYRQSGDKVETTRRTLAGYCCVLMFQLVLIGAAALAVGLIDGAPPPKSTGLLVVAAILRAGALGTTTMAFQLAVLHDRPALAALPSLCQWLAVLAALLCWPRALSDTRGLAVAAPCLPLMLAGLAFTLRALRRVGSHEAIRQIATAARWGWPLLASAALSIGIANVSRIYGFSHLAQSDLVALNFWLRVLSVVQLTHATAMTTLALEIYDHREPGILRSNLRRYLKTLSGALAVVSVLLVAETVRPGLTPTIGVSAFCVIGVYTLAWCLGAYLETYVTRDGRPDLVLRMAAITAGVYALLLFATRPSTVLSLALIMMTAALLNLALLARTTGDARPKSVSGKPA